MKCLTLKGFFTPAASAPPLCYLLNRYCVIIIFSAGADRGTGTLLSVILPVLCISFRAEGNLQRLFTGYFMNRLIVTHASVGDYL